MKTDPHTLLAAIVSPRSPDDDASLAQGDLDLLLTAARRRRRLRRARPVIALGALAALALLLLPPATPSAPPTTAATLATAVGAAPPANPALVPVINPPSADLLAGLDDPPTPAPLAPTVTTRPFPAEHLVVTRPGITPTVTTRPGRVATIQTRREPRIWTEIDDAQLLALVGGRGATLVRLPGGRQELRFDNPDDWRGFPVP